MLVYCVRWKSGSIIALKIKCPKIDYLPQWQKNHLDLYCIEMSQYDNVDVFGAEYDVCKCLC